MSRSARKHDKRLTRAKQKAKECRMHGCGRSKPREHPLERGLSIFPGFRRKTVEKAQQQER